MKNWFSFVGAKKKSMLKWGSCEEPEGRRRNKSDLLIRLGRKKRGNGKKEARHVLSSRWNQCLIDVGILKAQMRLKFDDEMGGKALGI